MKKIKKLDKNVHPEFHKDINIGSKLNWLRAAVLGANDGIVSIAGLVMGVAGATNSIHIILTAGIAGIIAGAISMAAGEYVSVSSSKDTEEALLKEEKYELEHFPEQELQELVDIYMKKGLTKKTAQRVAIELTENDPYAAHLDAELAMDPNNLTSPWHAAFASAISFLIGSSVPLVAVLISPPSYRIPTVFFSVVVALVLTGTVSARIGSAPVLRAVFRVVAGGAIAMAITYGIGNMIGSSTV